jgi:response regulator of citrate/malate metabolism
MKHTTDSILHIDIKEWLHNENLEKIEDFFQVKYTQTMKDAVTQYYERDNVLLDKYFPTWQNQSDEQLIEEMSIVDNKFSFYYGSEKE